MSEYNGIVRYVTFPLHILKFWYFESFIVLTRTWKNLILYIEEDLAVSLMLKLIFTPLFHDSTFLGRILSFIFRLVRIIIGLFAFAAATAILIAGFIYWLFLPGLAIFDIFTPFSQALLFVGIVLFIIHDFTHPHRKVWQIKNGDFWEASWILKKDVTFEKILNHPEVKNLITYLEQTQNIFHFNENSVNVDEVGKQAFELAKSEASAYISAPHFFIAMLKTVPDIDNFLLQFNLTLEDFLHAQNFLEKKKNDWRTVYLWDDDFTVRHLKGVNRGWLGVPTPALDAVSEDLTRKASQVMFSNFIGRVNTFAEVINVLSQATDRNVAVVGPAGAGKTDLINFLAKRIVSGDAPQALAIKRVVALDTTKLLSGIRTQGELAERVKNVFEEVQFADNIILVIEEVHNLGIGEAGSELNLFSLLLPYLDSSTFQFIVTTEPENYSRILEKNGAFARLFHKVELPPANEKEAIDILTERAIKIERKGKLKVSYLAIKKTAELASRLIHDRVLPDSGISIMEQAETTPQNGWITSRVVEEAVSRRVNMPLMDLGNVEKTKLLNLEQEIHERLIDQEEAVKVVADALRRSAVALREQNRPIGSFLFVGPTGVGKTELAKILSDVYFKSAGAFIRFDMSEYQSAESVGRLIGNVGQEGLLTEAVRNKPYALLLLDEFEKADPKILTLFLQVLEDGRLTDGSGRTIDFTNTIIIATSNAASITIAQGLSSGMSMGDLDNKVLHMLYNSQIFYRSCQGRLSKSESKTCGFIDSSSAFKSVEES